MTTRHLRTVQIGLAAAVGSILYLGPACLDLGTAHAGIASGGKSFEVTGVARYFKHRFAKFGHVDFGHPTIASTGVPGLYTTGMVKPGDWANDKLKWAFPHDATLKWLGWVAPTTENFYGMSFPVSSRTGFAVSGTLAPNVGSIFKSSNANGPDWNLVHTTTQLLADIDMVDEQTGWAVGLGGTVLKTTDGGTTWTPQFTDGVSIHYAISALDKNTAFIASNLGVVFKTTDGSNWSAIGNLVTGTPNHLLGIEFFDAMNGFAVGNSGTIIMTSDGGLTWTPSPSGVAVHLRGIHVHDAQTVWVAGNAGTVLKSVDAGASWAVQVSGAAVNLNDIAFASDGLAGFVAGNTGVMQQTYDGGATWFAGPASGASNFQVVVPARDLHYHANVWFAGGNAGTNMYLMAGGQQVTAAWAHANGSTESLEMYKDGVGDVVGGDGAPHNGTTTTLDNFEQWFMDVLGKNTSQVQAFKFNKIGAMSGAYYIFDASAAPSFPIGLATIEANWTFRYDSSDGQWLSVRSNGDTWVVVDFPDEYPTPAPSRLVVDMGGIHGSTFQYVDFDRLGLSEGVDYRLKVFVAYRESNMPNPTPAPDLVIATNALLADHGKPSILDFKD